MNTVLIAALVVGGIGILVGVLLVAAGEKFKVEVDEKEVAVREFLPGNNCGACGFPGCDGMAAAIAKGEAPVNGCPVGGPAAAEKIAGVMGVEAGALTKKVASIHCAGTCDKAVRVSNYTGLMDCQSAATIPGRGGKGCTFGCIGLGSCVKVCDFGAIHIEDGVAAFDAEKCAGCGKCVKTCPNGLIELIPVDAKYLVRCGSHEKGKAVKDVCQSGCIGCGLCQKNCPNNAITMQGNLPVFDYEKCQNCGACVAKCPTKAIKEL